MGTIGGRLAESAGWLAYTTKLVGLSSDREHSHRAVAEHAREQGVAAGRHRRRLVPASKDVGDAETLPVRLEPTRVASHQRLRHAGARRGPDRGIDVRVGEELINADRGMPGGTDDAERISFGGD